MSLKYKTFQFLTKDINDWEINHFYATHKSGLQYCIANGLLFFHVSSHKISVSIGFFNWMLLYYWIKDAQRLKIINESN